MSYQTLLAIHAGQDPMDGLDSAMELAGALNAQLDVLIINLATPVPTLSLIQNPEYDWSRDLQDQLNEAGDREAEVRAYLTETLPGANVSSECIQLGLIDQTVARKALYADLILFSRGQESFTGGMMGHALGGALFDAGRPALVLPEDIDALPGSPKKAIIAWDETAQSARAVAAALPMLQNSHSVELLAISGSDEEAGARNRLGKLQAWLARHKVNATLNVIPSKGRYVSHALVQTVNQSATDFLVMGAYGHMRIRERLFSGVTHEALSGVGAPLLLAH